MTDVSVAGDRNGTAPELRQLNLGVVWRQTFRTFGRAPLTFLALVLLPLIVSVIQLVVRSGLGGLGSGNAKALSTTGVLLVLAFSVLQYVVQLVSQAASIHIAARLLDGDRFTWGEALGVGLRRSSSLLGVVILVGLSVVLGLFLLVVPGVILALVLVLAVPACVLEQLGPIQSMKRSAFLTRSNRWRILAAFLVAIVLPIIAAAAIIIIAAFFLGKLALGLIASALIVIVLPSLGAISLTMLTVLFVELRALKEGYARPSVSRVIE